MSRHTVRRYNGGRKRRNRGKRTLRKTRTRNRRAKRATKSKIRRRHRGGTNGTPPRGPSRRSGPPDLKRQRTEVQQHWRAMLRLLQQRRLSEENLQRFGKLARRDPDFAKKFNELQPEMQNLVLATLRGCPGRTNQTVCTEDNICEWDENRVPKCNFKDDLDLNIFLEDNPTFQPPQPGSGPDGSGPGSASGIVPTALAY